MGPSRRRIDLEIAERWCRKAAEGGDALGQSNLASLLYESRRETSALKWWRRVAAQGHEDASIWLAVAAEEGKGCDQDVPDALAVYRVHATTSALAALRLGLCYERGVGVPKDVVEAERWCRVAAEAGEPCGWNNLACLLSEQGRDEEAFELFQRASDLGVVEAWETCGEIFAVGGGRPRDLPRGVDLLRRAASAGKPRAKFLLAWLFVSGECVGGSSEEAFRMCLQAAKAGVVDAQFLVGLMYERGDGVELDPVAARTWCQRAADRGHDGAASQMRL